MQIITQEELTEMKDILDEYIRYGLVEKIIFDENLSAYEKKSIQEIIRVLYKVTDILNGKAGLPFTNNVQQLQEDIIKNKNSKDYTKYTITFANGKKLEKISKRNLLTEVIKYLIGEESLGMHAFDRLFSANSCGRLFAKNKPDILYGIHLSEDDSDYKRYNKIDFSKYPNASNGGILYVANNWEKESIEKLVTYLNKEYKDFINIIEYQK